MDRTTSRRRALTILGLAPLGLAPLGLGGCGFRSMLAERPSSRQASVPSLLRKVYVFQVSYNTEGSARLAQDLRNALIDRLGEPDQPAYTLTLGLIRTLVGSGTTKTDSLTHQTLQATATYTLMAIDREGKAAPRTVLSGNDTAWANYDRLDSAYGDRMMERDMDTRVAERLADQIQGRLAAFFAAPDATKSKKP